MIFEPRLADDLDRLFGSRSYSLGGGKSDRLAAAAPNIDGLISGLPGSRSNKQGAHRGAARPGEGYL